MNGIIDAARNKQRLFTFATLAVALISILFFAMGQFVAALLVPVLAVLLVELTWRDEQARTLARLVQSDHPSEKLEVPRGAWGELCRALNALVQQYRVQQRLQSATPATLPREAMQALLRGELSAEGEPRVVSVLIVSSGALQVEDRMRRTAIRAWRALATTAQTQAQHHGALLQPCGDGLMIVFGAFDNRSADDTARTALLVINALQEAWRDSTQGREGPLAVSLASGTGLVTVVPGLGCCVLGMPVQQATQMIHMALETHYDGSLCSEAVYYSLRSRTDTLWQPTVLRLSTVNRNDQPVYSWREIGREALREVER